MSESLKTSVVKFNIFFFRINLILNLKLNLLNFFRTIYIYNTQNMCVCLTAHFLGPPTSYKLKTDIIRSNTT